MNSLRACLKKSVWLVAFVLFVPPTFAKGHGHGHRGHSQTSPGTGASRSSTHVNSYTTKKGKHVDGYDRSVEDGNFDNNWSTKGNVNPKTGEKGHDVTPEKGVDQGN